MKIFIRIALSALAIMLVLLSLAYPWMLILVAACVYGIIKADKLAEKMNKSVDKGKEDHRTAAPAAVQTVNKAPVSAPVRKEEYKVVGISYHKKAVENLGEYNSDYDYSKEDIIETGMEDTRIYEYNYFPKRTELVEEPDNKHDPNAVKVVVDGEHIGYLKSEDAAHVKQLIHDDLIASLSIEIYGGRYKIYYSDSGKLDQVRNDYGAKVTIRLK